MKAFLTLIISILIVLPSMAFAVGDSDIKWRRDWSPEIFKQAKEEGKFVILNMEAVWCHWCHVMDDKTYSDPKVIKLIEKYYIPVRIDQDSRPDLSERYGDWGWPATIFLDADGQEIVKRRGFFNAKIMAGLLMGILEDPSPLKYAKQDFAPSDNAYLTGKQKQEMISLYSELYDKRNGGWGRPHRFIIGAVEEYALRRAEEGEALYDKMAKKTLKSAVHLIDPVWGGAYQYSDRLNWLSPHFEKIMFSQKRYIEAYSNAYSLYGREEYLDSAMDIYRYLTDIMLSPEGVFYTSQDADLSKDFDGHAYYRLSDEMRRKRGMPRIDKAIYTSDNGWVIEALTKLYDASGNKDVLKKAVTAANWIADNYGNDEGGFIHGVKDKSGLYLRDNIAMARAYLSLYQSTADREWLKRATMAAEFIGDNFVDEKDKGFFNSVLQEGSIFSKPFKQVDENVDTTRFFNLLSYYSGEKKFKELAQHGMLYLSSSELTKNKPFKPGILLADEELVSPPSHIVILGSKDDEAAKKLYKASLAIASTYKQVEWYDAKEGVLPSTGGEITYPELPEAAAFACAGNRCSLPITDPKEISRVLKAFSAG